MLKRSMQSAILFALGYVGVIVKIAVLGRCVLSRLWPGRYFFGAMVILSLARSALSVSSDHLHPYLEFWNATQKPLVFLEAAAAIEAFWGLALHFRNIRRFALVLMSIIVVVSAGASAAVSLLRVHWNGTLSTPLLIAQYTQLGLLLTTLLCLAFFWQFQGVPIRPNAIRHLLALSALFLFFFTGNFIGNITRGQWRFMANLVMTGGAVVAFGAWALLMNRAGEALPFPSAPPMSVEEFEAAEAEDTAANRELKRASSEALRRVRRS